MLDYANNNRRKQIKFNTCYQKLGCFNLYLLCNDGLNWFESYLSPKIEVHNTAKKWKQKVWIYYTFASMEFIKDTLRIQTNETAQKLAHFFRFQKKITRKDI